MKHLSKDTNNEMWGHQSLSHSPSSERMKAIRTFLLLCTVCGYKSIKGSAAAAAAAVIVGRMSFMLARNFNDIYRGEM